MKDFYGMFAKIAYFKQLCFDSSLILAFLLYEILQYK